ncbi:MAG TPA: DUF1919 domain-containing protein [Caulobacteraceae bacterium]|jgi:uncharacterized protein (DUF1919 family)|nr:DUF1919 domain-containing protein [Caulobacteraceae bacterium]
MAALAIESALGAALRPHGLGALRASVLRTLVGAEPFSIVSNNCWGAHIYQALGIPYATPFVGLFIPPRSYLTLLGDFDRLVRADLVFVAASQSEVVNAWREREGLRYPIGLLGGQVEIDFQHYPSEAAARAAWRRRTARIVPDPRRRFFKFDDREGATPADLDAFGGLELPHKVCFTARAGQSSAIVVPPAPGEDHAPDGVALAAISRRYFNTLRWISTLPTWTPAPSLI